MERRKNVYELVQERLDMIFKEFDNIYVSFSGGKDSGVLLNLCIDYIRKHNLKRKIGVFHLDYEIQYRMTLDYVGRTPSVTSGAITFSRGRSKADCRRKYFISGRMSDRCDRLCEERALGI